MNRPLRAVIADDEPLALKRLEIGLARAADVAVVGRAVDGLKAVSMIRELRPDVVFLDIKMPGLDGVQVAEIVKAPGGPQLVFVTAFDRFGPKAFDCEAVDYLQKPFAIERLLKAVERVRARVAADSAAGRAADLERIVGVLQRETEPYEESGSGRLTEFWLPVRGGRVRVPVSAIKRLEAEGDYVRIHTDQASYLLRASISGLADQLDPGVFCRVHRSHIVRLAAVTRVTRAGRGELNVVLDSGATAPVSRRSQAVVMIRLTDVVGETRSLLPGADWTDG